MRVVAWNQPKGVVMTDLSRGDETPAPLVRELPDGFLVESLGGYENRPHQFHRPAEPQRPMLSTGVVEG